MADSEEKFGRLVSEFGGVYERIKLRVNVGKSFIIIIKKGRQCKTERE